MERLLAAYLEDETAEEEAVDGRGDVDGGGGDGEEGDLQPEEDGHDNLGGDEPDHEGSDGLPASDDSESDDEFEDS